MRTNGQKKRGVSIDKTEYDAISPVHTYAPYFFLSWLQLFGVQRRVKRIFSKEIFLLFCPYLNLLRHVVVTTHKLCSENYSHVARLFLPSQFAQRSDFACPASSVVALCSINAFQKIIPVKTEIGRKPLEPVCVKLNNYFLADRSGLYGYCLTHVTNIAQNRPRGAVLLKRYATSSLSKKGVQFRAGQRSDEAGRFDSVPLLECFHCEIGLIVEAASYLSSIDAL
jgi:hypothetical protein